MDLVLKASLLSVIIHTQTQTFKEWFQIKESCSIKKWTLSLTHDSDNMVRSGL